jgi:hypothetical protein
VHALDTLGGPTLVIVVAGVVVSPSTTIVRMTIVNPARHARQKAQQPALLRVSPPMPGVHRGVHAVSIPGIVDANDPHNQALSASLSES